MIDHNQSYHWWSGRSFRWSPSWFDRAIDDRVDRSDDDRTQPVVPWMTGLNILLVIDTNETFHRWPSKNFRWLSFKLFCRIVSILQIWDEIMMSVHQRLVESSTFFDLSRKYASAWNCLWRLFLLLLIQVLCEEFHVRTTTPHRSTYSFCCFFIIVFIKINSMG